MDGSGDLSLLLDRPTGMLNSGKLWQVTGMHEYRVMAMLKLDLHTDFRVASNQLGVRMLVLNSDKSLVRLTQKHTKQPTFN